jgi:hypothetical protein
MSPGAGPPVEDPPPTGADDSGGGRSGPPEDDNDDNDFGVPDRSGPPPDSGEEGDRLDDATPSPDPGVGGPPVDDGTDDFGPKPDRRGPSERDRQREIAREIEGISQDDIADTTVQTTDVGEQITAELTPEAAFERRQDRARERVDVDDPTVTSGDLDTLRERRAEQQFEQQRERARQTADIDAPTVSNLGGAETDELNFEATSNGVEVTPDRQRNRRPTGEFGRGSMGTSFETPAEQVSLSGDGPIAGTGIPGTDTTIGGALDTGAREFDERVVDPAADLSRRAGERDLVLGAGGTSVEGSQARGQLAEDFGRSAAGALNIPAFGAIGVRGVDEAIRQSGRGGPGTSIALTSDPERTERTGELTQEAGSAAVEFAQENPARTGAFVAGGVAGGLGAGLAARGATRGARGAGRAIRNADTSDLQIRSFLDDTRGQRTIQRQREREIDVSEVETDAERQAREITDQFDDPDALAREQARILERDQMPPRDVFDSDEAFEQALDRRVARRLETDVDEVTLGSQRTRPDTRTQTRTGAIAPGATAATAGAFATRAEDLGFTFGTPTTGGAVDELGAFAEEAESDLGVATTTGEIDQEVGLDTETRIIETTDTPAVMDTRPITETRTQTDTVVDTIESTDTTTRTTTDTTQLFDEPTLTTTETITRTTERPPRTPEVDIPLPGPVDDDAPGVDVFGSGALVEFGTRTLTEADEQLVDSLDDFNQDPF